MAKKMIVKGVGTFMAKKYHADGKGVEVLTLGTLQDLQINLNVEMDDIFGGDGLFAIDTLVQSKSIEITATDAKFDLGALQLMMGSNIQEQVEGSLWVLNEQKTLASETIGITDVATAPVDFKGSLHGDGNFAVRLKDSNLLLERVPFVEDSEPRDNEFMYDTASGKLILNSAYAGMEVTFNYQRTDIIDIVDILGDEVPFPVHVVHHGSFLQKDGTYQGIETELFSCRAQGSFTIDAQRATASTSSISLQVLDPERADGKLGSIKRYQSTIRV